MSDASKSILIVVADKKAQRTVHRILGSTFCKVEAVESLAAADEAMARLSPFLVVIDHQMLVAPEGQRLVTVPRGDVAPPACLVLMDDPGGNGLPALLDVGSLTNLLANPMPLLAEELTVTALKLLRRDIFGLEKYLSWGVEVRSLELADADDRGAAVDALARDVRESGLGQRVVQAASLVADELLSNALYNAPIDDAGERFRGDEPRHGSRPLLGRERVRLRYACDARYFAIEVSDRYGSLDRNIILRCLAKSVVRSSDKVDMRGRGAGIGIAMVYGCCNHLVFNIDPGRRTEVISLMDVRFRPTELNNMVCSFGVFAERGAEKG
jgi:hypothetical protein